MKRRALVLTFFSLCFSLFFTACKRQSAEISKLEKDLQQDPKALEALDADGLSRLHLAVKKGDVQLAGFLLDKGLNGNVRDKTGQTPVHVAAEMGDLKMLELFNEKKVFLDEADDINSRPLMAAILAKKEEAALYLLDNGASSTSVLADGRSVIHLAAQVGLVKVLRKLVEKGANVERESATGDTALHFAAWNGQEEAVSVLLELKGNPKWHNHARLRPIDLAKKAGHQKVVDLLAPFQEETE